jgi:hypothetical protein
MDPIGIFRAAAARREAMNTYEASRRAAEDRAALYRAEGMNRQMYIETGWAIVCRRAFIAERDDPTPPGLPA